MSADSYNNRGAESIGSERRRIHFLTYTFDRPALEPRTNFPFTS